MTTTKFPGNWTKEQVNELYVELRKRPDGDYREAFKNPKLAANSNVNLSTLQTVAVIGRIANGSTAEEFENFIITGDVPAIKLNRAEMEAVAGGKVSDWLHGAAVVLGAAAGILAAIPFI